MTSDNVDAVMSMATAHWDRSFTGISSLDVSRRIGSPHDSVLKLFDELEQRGLATLKRDVRAVSISVPLVPGAVEEEPREVVHTILFPSQQVLAEVFERENKDHGPYLNRLHKGESQLAMSYFKVDVLRKYSDGQDKYHFDDDIIGGTVATKDAYYFSVPEETRHEETFARVRYGKRRLLPGGVAITAILKDLGHLPYKEQLYWQSFELENPVFAEDDASFQRFIRQNFYAEFVDHEDPIQMVYEAIARVNDRITAGQLFRVTSRNPHLHYPVINNERAYSASHNELRKLVGADNLDAKQIKGLLKSLGVHFHKDEKPWALFKKLVATVAGHRKDEILEPLERVARQRSLVAHEIREPRLTSEDYVERFKGDCGDVACALDALADFLTESVGPEGAPPCLER